MQTKRSSITEAALNVAIGTVVAFVVTQELHETAIIIFCSFARAYTLRRIFTDKR